MSQTLFCYTVLVNGGMRLKDKVSVVWQHQLVLYLLSLSGQKSVLFPFFRIQYACNLHARRLFDSILAVIGDGHVHTLALAHHAISLLLLISASNLFLIHAEVRSSYYHTMSYKLVTEQQFRQICREKTIN